MDPVTRLMPVLKIKISDNDESDLDVNIDEDVRTDDTVHTSNI